MDWHTLPGFDEKYSRITIKEHKSLGCKTVEVLYGAQDENGNPIESTPHPYMRFSMKMPFAVKKGDIIRSAGK